MAYSIKLSNVSSQHLNLISTMLCLQPESVNNKYNRVVPAPITFYDIQGDTIRLPYLFAANLFKITDINFPYLITNLTFTGTLREHQIGIEAESWQQLEQYGTSTLGLYPGFGKTILGAKLSSRAKLLTVILVNREILTIQWKATYERFTNAKVWIVGEKNPPPTCDVIICMDMRWQHIAKETRDKCGFLIIDECHSFCTPTHVTCLLAFAPKYILCESASLHRDDNMHTMIYAMAGERGIFRESNLPFNVMKIITNTKPVRKMNRQKGVDFLALQRSVLFDERRNRIILDIISRNTQYKILVLTSLCDHVAYLHDETKKMGISCDFLCGTKKGYIDTICLIGSFAKIGTGFDPSTSCPSYTRPFDLLLLVSSIKKYSMLVQNVGRIFRCEFPTVIHFVDSDDIYKSHWSKCRKWYLSHGGFVTEHNIENKEQPVASTDNITAQQLEWSQNKINEMKINKGLTLNIKK